MFFLVKDTQYYYFQTQYEPYKTDPSKWDNKGPRLGGRKASGYGSAVYSGKYWVPNICGKIKRSIWEINTQKQKDKSPSPPLNDWKFSIGFKNKNTNC